MRAPSRLTSAVVILVGVGIAVLIAKAERDRRRLARLPDVKLDQFGPTARRLIGESFDAVKREPLALERWAALGYALQGNGASVAAASCFLRCEELDAEDERWPHLVGHCLLMSDRAGAIAALERSLKRRPEGAGPIAMLAEIHLEEGDDELAEALLRERVTSSCMDARLLLTQARVDANAGRSETALRWANLAAKHDPHRRAIHVLLAQLYARTKDAERHRREARLLELLPPADQEGSWPDPIIDRAVKFDRSVEAMTIRAFSLVENGNSLEALKLMDELAPEDRSTAPVTAVLALADAYRGRFDEAFARLDRAPANQQPRLFFTRGLAKATQRKYEEAAELFGRAAALVESEGRRTLDSPYYNRGVCFEMLLRDDEAINAYEKSLAANPGHLESLKRLAAIYINRRRFAEARRLLADAELLAPKDPAVHELKRNADG